MQRTAPPASLYPGRSRRAAGPDKWPTYVLPYYRRIIEALGPEGCWMHSELLRREHLPLLRDLGLVEINFAEDQYLTIQDVQAELPGVPFGWHILCVSEMQQGTPDLIRRRYREIVVTGVDEGRCELTVGTPPENIRAFLEWPAHTKAPAAPLVLIFPQEAWSCAEQSGPAARLVDLAGRRGGPDHFAGRVPFHWRADFQHGALRLIAKGVVRNWNTATTAMVIRCGTAPARPGRGRPPPPGCRRPVRAVPTQSRTMPPAASSRRPSPR